MVVKHFVRLEFSSLSFKQLEHLFAAEHELLAAGVSFDIGYNLVKGLRVWKLDSSLKGAAVLPSVA